MEAKKVQSMIMKEIPMYTVGTGKGDGYMNCWSCGERMTIVEVAHNEYKGPTLRESHRIIRWCDKCVPAELNQ